MKVSGLITVRVEGRKTRTKEVSELNAESPTVDTELGMVTTVSEEHEENALLPMDVAEVGIEMEGNAVQREKAEAPIVETAVGIITGEAME